MALLLFYSLICIFGIYLITRKDFFEGYLSNTVVFGGQSPKSDRAREFKYGEALSTEDSMAMDTELQNQGLDLMEKL